MSAGPTAADGAAADFLVAAESALALLGEVAVLQRWSEPSALAQMSVGAVAAHLGSQVLLVHAAVTAGTAVTDERPVPLLEHYSRVAWVEADVDDAPNVVIRAVAEESAGPGHDALVRSVEQALADLRSAFSTDLPTGLPPAIRLPHWDWAVSFEDFLVTRVMEIVVHSDDLAVSVDADPPRLPDPVLGPVLALLVGLSLRKHGQSAVVRTLSRSERAPRSVSAF